MEAQWCLCGAQAGYPHRAECPRPLYRASEAQEDQWIREMAEILSRSHPEERSGHEDGLIAAAEDSAPRAQDVRP